MSSFEDSIKNLYFVPGEGLFSPKTPLADFFHSFVAKCNFTVLSVSTQFKCVVGRNVKSPNDLARNAKVNCSVAWPGTTSGVDTYHSKSLVRVAYKLFVSSNT